MVSRATIDVTIQRMQETEKAIDEQRRYVESLTDPALRAIATRTLTTLEDMLLIMQRTHGLLVATASGAAGPSRVSASQRAAESSGAPSARGS